MPNLSALEPWYTALRSPSGVRVRVSDFSRARAALYKARADSGDASLKTLSICQSPTDPLELWIVHASEPQIAPQENLT